MLLQVLEKGGELTSMIKITVKKLEKKAAAV